jgi:hypothetical protein
MIKWWSYRENHRQRPRQLRRKKPEPCSDLWDLVVDMDWESVIEHARENSVDAAYQDGHWHETPLYLAVQHNPPVEAIREIIRAYPKALTTRSPANHDLPLHIACRYQVSAEILEELLRVFPGTAIEQTRWGPTPVMALWEFRPKDEPLDERFWRKVNILVSAVARFRDDPKFQEMQPATRWTKQFRNPEKRTTSTPPSSTAPAALPNKNEGNELLMVHAVVSLGALGCPEQVLEHVLHTWPEQVFLRDRWGQLPLHIAVGPTTWSHTTRRKYKPRGEKFLFLLLQTYPQSATQRLLGDDMDSGRFPLHSSLANRHTWKGGVQELFHAAPQVLLMPDPLTKLYPFQLAAVLPSGDITVELDTVYLLLRAQPDVLNLFDACLPAKQIAAVTVETIKLTSKTGPVPHAIHHDALLGSISAIVIGGAFGFIF